MDNLSTNQRDAIRKLIRAAGASRRYLPPNSPDSTPIEKNVARLKAITRKAGERTGSGLWDRIGQLVDTFEQRKCANLSSYDYDPA